MRDPQYYDPRVWVREGEKTLCQRVKEACTDLGNVSEYMPRRSLSKKADLLFRPTVEDLVSSLRRSHLPV